VRKITEQLIKLKKLKKIIIKIKQLKKPIKLIKILKKLSVSVQFYKLEIKKTKPN
jgi:hypothetical protein